MLGTVKRGNFEEILRFLGYSFQENACMVLKLAMYNILHPKENCVKFHRPMKGVSYLFCEKFGGDQSNPRWGNF